MGAPSVAAAPCLTVSSPRSPQLLSAMGDGVYETRVLWYGKKTRAVCLSGALLLSFSQVELGLVVFVSPLTSLATSFKFQIEYKHTHTHTHISHISHKPT